MNPHHPANQPFDFRVSFRSLIIPLPATDFTGPYSVRFEMIPMIDAPGSPRGVVDSSLTTLLTYFPTVRHGFPDRVRSVLNEGGLFGERAGWHLPGFDTSNWVAWDLSAGLPSGNASVGFFSTEFPPHIPPGFNVMLSFTFDESALG
ncbi:hypothetical protein EDB89DRAFT_657033 [Lactarius sanguifluus]|nr:hypothetical protein EDB89DRAFT_657033 [Lactarius sanguifluus]